MGQQKKQLEIRMRQVPKELFKTIQDRQVKHMRKCSTCKYGLGAATIAYIHELQKEIRELKQNQSR